MQNATHSSLLAPKPRLFTSRVTWVALVLGLLVIAVILGVFVVYTGDRAETRIDDDNGGGQQICFAVCAAIAVVLIPAALAVRGWCHRRGRNDDGTIASPLYETGNIAGWAMLEGVIVINLVVSSFVLDSFWPYMIPGGVAFIVMVMLPPKAEHVIPPRDRLDAASR